MTPAWTTADFLADMPGCVVPDQQPGPLSFGSQLGNAPGQKLGGQAAQRTSVNKAQPQASGHAGLPPSHNRVSLELPQPAPAPIDKPE